MKKLLFILLLFTTVTMFAQSPVIKTYAYSRNTLSGIREEIAGEDAPRKSPFPTEYFLYVEVKKGTKLTLAGVCLEGVSYNASLKKVATPVLLTNNSVAVMNDREVLVKKTMNDVYAITLKHPKEAGSMQGNNKSMITFKSNNKTIKVPVKEFKPLRPLAAM